jgi:hypothetical protein
MTLREWTSLNAPKSASPALAGGCDGPACGEGTAEGEEGGRALVDANVQSKARGLGEGEGQRCVHHREVPEAQRERREQHGEAGHQPRRRPRFPSRPPRHQPRARPAVPVTSESQVNMITTLIPAYKVQYVAQLLSCLASQNYKKFRVIISDDSPNNEVTAAIRQLQMKGLVSGLSLSIVEGPKKGAHANLLHLLKTWNNSSPLVHFLFDDDLIYPSFYQMHLTAHTNAKISASVSYRWIGDETGAPVQSPRVPEFIANSNKIIELLNADQLFETTVPYCVNWLGEFSNAVFSGAAINLFHEQTLSGMTYYGLGDVGLLLQASLSSDIAIIKEHLGVFRMNPHQNTGNFASVSFRCAYVAWIALALASRDLGKINKQQAAQSIESISNMISAHFQPVEEMLQFARLREVFDVGSAEFKSAFDELWHEMLMTDTPWASTRSQG